MNEMHVHALRQRFPAMFSQLGAERNSEPAIRRPRTAEFIRTWTDASALRERT